MKEICYLFQNFKDEVTEELPELEMRFHKTSVSLYLFSLVSFELRLRKTKFEHYFIFTTYLYEVEKQSKKKKKIFER